MTIEEAIRSAQVRARQLRVDPQATITEVYQAELLRRLQEELRGWLAWKGGTVLRLEGSERISRDLDATRKESSLTKRRLMHVLQRIATVLPYLADSRARVEPRSVVAEYRFAVPAVRHPIRITIEVSTREAVLLPTTTTTTARIAHPYGLQPVVIARLDSPEILAEKVRALVMRRASRDIYDVYLLLQQGVEFQPELFRKKMDYYRTLGKTVDPQAALERAAAWLEAANPARIRTELANLFPAAQRSLDFAVILTDVARAVRSWTLQVLMARTRPPRRRKTARK